MRTITVSNSFQNIPWNMHSTMCQKLQWLAWDLRPPKTQKIRILGKMSKSCAEYCKKENIRLYLLTIVLHSYTSHILLFCKLYCQYYISAYKTLDNQLRSFQDKNWRCLIKKRLLMILNSNVRHIRVRGGGERQSFLK